MRDYEEKTDAFALYNALLCLLVAAVFVLSILGIQVAEVFLFARRIGTEEYTIYCSVHLIIACGAETPVSRLTSVQALCDLYGLSFRGGGGQSKAPPRPPVSWMNPPFSPPP